VPYVPQIAFCGFAYCDCLCEFFMKRIIQRSKEKRHIVEAMIVSHFSQYPDAQRAVIEIREDKDTRSQKQNKLYWMWLGIINQETGMPVHDYFEDSKWHKGLHTGFKHKFLIRIEYEDGDIKEPSSKNLKVKEFKDFLEKIDMEMAQLGITLPRPEDLYIEAMGYV